MKTQFQLNNTHELFFSFNKLLAMLACFVGELELCLTSQTLRTCQ